MGSNAKVIVLIVIIVACLAFVGYRMFGGSGGSTSGPGSEAQGTLICTECGATSEAGMDPEKWTPMMQQGVNCPDKAQCPECGKTACVAAIKCPACGEMIPSPGMQALMMSMGQGGRTPPCPKCKKPIDVSKIQMSE